MIKLLKGDCLELMKGIPDKSIDMILCDLPYGISACKWDKIVDLEKMWKQYERIITDKGAIVLFGAEPFSSHLRLSNLKLYKYDWKWIKNKGTNFLNSSFQPLKFIEDVMVFSKSASSYSKNGSMNYFPIKTGGHKSYDTPRKNVKPSSNIRSKFERKEKNNVTTRFPKNYLFFNTVGNKTVHPTQKPVDLLEYLIKTYTLEGMTVLDNCMGSGSTGVACKNLNRNFIGIELDEEYFNIAKKRIGGVADDLERV